MLIPLAQKLSLHNRERKWKVFIDNFIIADEITILDVGYSDIEFSKGDNYIEKNYPFTNKITALGIEKPNEICKRYPNLNVVQYDGGIFPFSDNSFDICWSNAVLEHVGDWQRQLLFLHELYRTSKAAFITTPNKYFPFEVHTRIPLLHFLPKKVFDLFLIKIRKNWATGDYMNLLSLRKLRNLLKEANIDNYKIIKNKFLFLSLNFIVIWKR